MAEYIEREDVREEFRYHFDEEYADECVDRLPAADVAQVVHGRWEWETYDIYRCSNCKEKSHVKEVMGLPAWDYCPNCGAKMDGGGDHA